MMTKTKTVAIGTRVRFQHPLSNGGTLRFTARVVKIDGEFAWVEIPASVRRVPFAPLGGKRYGKYAIAKLAIVEAVAR